MIGATRLSLSVHCHVFQLACCLCLDPTGGVVALYQHGMADTLD